MTEQHDFKKYNTIGEQEKIAALNVIKTGCLSDYLGTWSNKFYGGNKVRELEKQWSEYFGVKNSVAVNSATSGLYAAVGAVGIGPGDEVIVPPYTMSATVGAVLAYNAVPVFCDITEQGFSIDPCLLEKKITDRSKAVMVVDLFGYPAHWEQINKTAQKYGLKIIEDAAQAPGALYKGKPCGTFGDIGVFSLNYHKHIHCGEGGIAVTDNDDYADKLMLIRNHAESVVEEKGNLNLINMLGWNYRLTEIQAAIALKQLKKLDGLVSKKRKQAELLINGLKKIDGIYFFDLPENWEPVYYVLPFRFTGTKKMNREKLYPVLIEKGIPVSKGYVKPLYLLPVFQKQICYGDMGCPFSCHYYGKKISYPKGLCPVCEKMHEQELMYIPLCSYDFSREDINFIIKSFKDSIS